MLTLIMKPAYVYTMSFPDFLKVNDIMCFLFNKIHLLKFHDMCFYDVSHEDMWKHFDAFI